MRRLPLDCWHKEAIALKKKVSSGSEREKLCDFYFD
jgi:hypothetical protein